MNELEIGRRRQRVAEMYAQGHTRDSIAVELGVAQGTVSTDLAIVRGAWVESSKDDLEKLKADVLAKFQFAELVSWAAFQRTGNPSHIRNVIRCLELRSKMVGLLKESSVQINVGTVDWDALADGTDPIEERLQQCLAESSGNGESSETSCEGRAGFAPAPVDAQ